MFKYQGKAVLSNDYMAMSATFTKAMVENNGVILPLDLAEQLLHECGHSDYFVEQHTFRGLFYSDENNRLIDPLRCNIALIDDEYQIAIALTALIRACLMKRPSGIFTYVADRYDDGRKDLQKSFEQQFLEAVADLNAAMFDNGMPNQSRHGDAQDLYLIKPNLDYIDPPYYSLLSYNEYARRYHFVESISRNWQGLTTQANTKTKKFKSYPSPFSTEKGAYNAFDKLFATYQNSIIVVSYSSNNYPTRDEFVALLSKYKQHVEVIDFDYKYCFGTQKDAASIKNTVQEYLLISR